MLFAGDFLDVSGKTSLLFAVTFALFATLCDTVTLALFVSVFFVHFVSLFTVDDGFLSTFDLMGAFTLLAPSLDLFGGLSF